MPTQCIIIYHFSEYEFIYFSVQKVPPETMSLAGATSSPSVCWKIQVYKVFLFKSEILRVAGEFVSVDSSIQT